MLYNPHEAFEGNKELKFYILVVVKLHWPKACKLVLKSKVYCNCLLCVTCNP